MSLTAIWIILKIIGAAIGVLVAVIAFITTIIGFIIKIRELTSKNKSIKLDEQINAEKFSPQYTREEIKSAVDGYIQPDCSVTDPSNQADLVSYADIRENIFTVVDKAITFSTQRRHQLILADSGMGKTSFCLNYFDHFTRNNKDQNIALISLAEKDSLKRISSIERKSSTVLMLDALDEDPKAIDDGSGRLFELLQAASDFRCVIVTCRSQFFANDAAIPQDTGVSIVTPRRAGQNTSYKLHRSYLSPFNDKQIRAYIRSHFPIWSIFGHSKRKKAYALVSNVRELAARPMLLELLPMLVKEQKDVKEVFDLYKFMVDKWLEREAAWISPDRLLSISKHLAVTMHKQQSAGQGDRLTLSQLNGTAHQVSEDQSDWKHLTTRSLLNRDSDGKFKFAHRSIMEYLFVVAALEDNPDCFGVRWTDLMREFFISWGYTEEGISQVDLARSILQRDLAPTGLWPLSEPPSQPQFVGAPDFERAAARRDVGQGGRRSANALWRNDNVRIEQTNDSVSITDLEYNLHWRLVDSSVKTEISALPLRLSVSEMQKLAIGREERLPSYAEFITLIECLEAAGRSRLVPNNTFYLLGDKLGDRRHLVVGVGMSKQAFDNCIIIDRDRVASFTKRKVTVLETGIFVNPESLGLVNVAPALVKSAF